MRAGDLIETGWGSLEWKAALGELPGERQLRQLLPLVHEAGNPYYDWFFGDEAIAKDALASWVRRPSSELFAGRAVMLLAGDTVAGSFLAPTGAELSASRLADMLAASSMLSRERVRDKVEGARQLFAENDPDDRHLSIIAVAEPFRGRGLGRLLLQRFVDDGHAAGSTRFTLDVSAGDTAAIRLYEAVGFRVYHEGRTQDGALRYLGMQLRD